MLHTKVYHRLVNGEQDGCHVNVHLYVPNSITDDSYIYCTRTGHIAS